jgi:hypothetical protein
VRKALVVLSLVTLVGVTVPLSAGAEDVPLGAPIDRSTLLTFSGPVLLPHVALPAGTYLFRFVDFNRSSLVQVLSADGKTPYAEFDTMPVSRSREAAKSGDVVTFKEARTGDPRPMDVWYFDETRGCELIY